MRSPSGGGRRPSFEQRASEHIEESRPVIRASLLHEVRRSHARRNGGQVVSSRDQHDGDLLLSAVVQAHLPSHSRAVEDRHIEIEKKAVGKGGRRQGRESLFAVVPDANPVADGFEELSRSIGHLEIVVHDE
jgi:hypothetical protein